MDNNVIPFQPKGQEAAPLVFSFGDPTPILDNNIYDYTGTFLDIGGSYYNPPISLRGLAKIMGANAYHGSILHFKKNMLCKWFVPSPILSLSNFRAAALDFTVTDNCYFQKFTDRFGKVTRLERLPAIAMRRGREPGKYIRLVDDSLFQMGIVEYKKGEVIHLKGPDVRQSIYGIPEYMGGIQAVLLSEDATLFRRKYYLNGAHMGFILVTNDAGLDESTAKTIEQKVRQSKGIGNFSSLYINIPRSASKEPVQIIPVGDIGTKDEYQRIKETTEAELLAMHRMRPELMGIIPKNSGGFADPEKTMRVYHELEVQSMQQIFLELNDIIPGEPVRFKDPVWQTTPPVIPATSPTA
ncbi:MAG: phage portal protein [Methylococcales bacterium]